MRRVFCLSSSIVGIRSRYWRIVRILPKCCLCASPKAFFRKSLSTCEATAAIIRRNQLQKKLSELIEVSSRTALNSLIASSLWALWQYRPSYKSIAGAPPLSHQGIFWPKWFSYRHRRTRTKIESPEQTYSFEPIEDRFCCTADFPQVCNKDCEHLSSSALDRIVLLLWIDEQSPFCRGSFLARSSAAEHQREVHWSAWSRCYAEAADCPAQ